VLPSAPGTYQRVEKIFHVCILTGKSGVLYTGVTSRLALRVSQHLQKNTPGFTSKYNVGKLVWFEAHRRGAIAIAWEKEIKAWRRAKRVALIQQMNPEWKDLSAQIH
jgi:putative endonuclease